MLFLVVVTSTQHYWVVSAERRRMRWFPTETEHKIGHSDFPWPLPFHGHPITERADVQAPGCFCGYGATDIRLALGFASVDECPTRTGINERIPSTMSNF
jgi:hypothetical protein